MRLCLFTAHMGTFVLGKKGGGLLPTESYFSFFLLLCRCNANRRIIALVIVENEFSYRLHLLKKKTKTTILRSNKYTSLQ